MNARKVLKLIELVSETAEYPKLINFLFNEDPPSDHNFLERTNLACIEELLRSRAYGDGVRLTLDRPRHDAKVGFLLRLPFDFFTYREVYANVPESEFILDGAWILKNIPSGGHFLKKLASFLDAEGVAFRILQSDSDPEKFFDKYRAVVCGSKNTYITEKKIKGRKIHLMYTQSKDAYTFGLWLRYFDCALTFGPYSHELMSPVTESIPVGNPRFDRWFKNRSNITPFSGEPQEPSKPTVLYLPTHGDLSSLLWAAPAIKALCSSYNIIIRPHSFTTHLPEAQKILDEFKRFLGEDAQRISWADDFVDSLSLFAAADVVLSDNSGSIFDAILVDKPLVLIDALPPDYFEEKMWQLQKYSPESWIIPGTYPDSIEQKIKREKDLQPGVVIDSPEALPAAIQEAIEQENVYQRRRMAWRKKLFVHADGEAGKRAGLAIQSRIREAPRQWNLLNYSSEEALFGQSAYSLKRLKELQSAARPYVNLATLTEAPGRGSEVEFSIIVPTFNGPLRIRKALQSLVSQGGITPDQYEIIIADDGSQNTCRDAVESIMEEYPRHKIQYVFYSKNRGPAFARNIGIKQANGKYICFTDDDCIVPPDWLVNFRKDFETHPEIAGSGGWYRPIASNSEKIQVLNRFVFWEPLPYILKTMKSVFFYGNYAGNTANTCYLKSVLEKVGGFNYYFVFASVEDWELKVKIHKQGFALLYNRRLIEHAKSSFSFADFIRFYLIRGWSGFLLYTIHREYSSYHRTPSSALAQFLQARWQFAQVRKSKTFKSFPGLGYSHWFPLINAFRYFLLWVGKYGIVLWGRLDTLSRY